MAMGISSTRYSSLRLKSKWTLKWEWTRTYGGQIEDRDEDNGGTTRHSKQGEERRAAKEKLQKSRTSDCDGQFNLVWIKCILRWVYETIKLVLFGKREKREFRRYTVVFFCLVRKIEVRLLCAILLIHQQVAHNCQLELNWGQFKVVLQDRAGRGWNISRHLCNTELRHLWQGQGVPTA